MSRDETIENTFLVADDAIQGLWGLHSFVRAAVDSADRTAIKDHLPPGAFQLTHEWARFYQPEELVKEMDNVFEFIHCRNSLVLLASVFEGAVRRFNDRLSHVSHARKFTQYKPLLRWVFELVRNTQSGSSTMRDRLPRTCGDIDHARRLRNCFAHNNGRYNRFYVDDSILDGWVTVQSHESGRPMAVTGQEKIFVANAQLEHILRSHIEVLHITYNTIQRRFFGETQDYSYATEGKQIEWHRILSGQTFVGM